jgi:DNA-directed RNA polymerase specialized sigma24 family protein
MQFVERVSQEQVSDRSVLTRQHHEKLLALAQCLARPERLLVEQVLQHQMTLAEVADLSGIPRRTLQHRFARLIQYIQHKRYRYLAAHLETLPRDLRSVAKYHFLQRKTLRETAKVTGRSLHQVRQSRLRIIAMLDIEVRQWRG